MRPGTTKAPPRRRPPADISSLLSNAQREWLRPLLIAKLKDPAREIPFKRIRSLALFRELRTSRRLEVLIQAEISDLQRLQEVTERRRSRQIQEWRRLEAARMEEFAQTAVRHALQYQVTQHEEQLAEVRVEYAENAKANQVAVLREKGQQNQELAHLRAVEAKLRCDLASAEAALHAVYTNELGPLRERLRHTQRVASAAEARHENELRCFSEQYEAIKKDLEAARGCGAAVLSERDDTRLQNEESTELGLPSESSLQLKAAVTALKAAEDQVRILQSELITFRAEPDLETRMRSLMWACRRLPSDIAMDDVRREVARAYVGAYATAHRITPRRLQSDVEVLLKEWWFQRCQVAHKTDHGFQLGAYDDNSRRILAILDEIETALV